MLWCCTCPDTQCNVVILHWYVRKLPCYGVVHALIHSVMWWYYTDMSGNYRVMVLYMPWYTVGRTHPLLLQIWYMLATSHAAKLQTPSSLNLSSGEKTTQAQNKTVLFSKYNKNVSGSPYYAVFIYDNSLTHDIFRPFHEYVLPILILRGHMLHVTRYRDNVQYGIKCLKYPGKFHSLS